MLILMLAQIIEKEPAGGTLAPMWSPVDVTGSPNRCTGPHLCGSPSRFVTLGILSFSETELKPQNQTPPGFGKTWNQNQTLHLKSIPTSYIPADTRVCNINLVSTDPFGLKLTRIRVNVSYILYLLSKNVAI